LLDGAGGATRAGDEQQAVESLLDRAAAQADEFASEHRGKVAELDPEGLRAAMERLGELSELIGRAANYAHLRFAADTADPANGALVALVTERATAIRTELIFFELEWVALEDDRAEELLALDGAERYAHYLREERRYKPHVLTDPEERILTELSVTGRSAWDRLFDELTSAIRVDLDGEAEPASLDVALARLHDPDRETRKSAAEAVTEALQPGLRTRAYVFNTLLQDKAISDRLRSYPHWLASRNLSNEASDESVAALVEAVKGRYGLARRWYETKARLLGIDKLADYDRAASVVPQDEDFEWPAAKDLVVDSFASFSEQAAEIADGFFTDRFIDAPPDPSKRGGAFSASTVPSVHPYVMLNYTGKRRDVLTLAHELGHGLHQTLAREQGVFHQNTPLTVAETASVFAEEIVFGRLLDAAEEPGSRLGLLAEAIEGQIATVFRQIAMNQFEDAVHTARRSEGELAPERFGELWAETQVELLGDSVEVTDNYRSWWSYVPHFIGSPGYVYAYAYGQLLALSVYRLYQERGQDLVPDYIEMLSAGGSRGPEELGKIVGVDLADPGFWDSGLDLVEEQLDQAVEAAEAVIAGK
jgi:oligoendopeptidase F